MTEKRPSRRKGYLYILRCSDGSYYTGSTTDLDYRVEQHKVGLGSAYTARRLPVKVVFSCEFPSAYDAFERERQVKGWSRLKKEALIRGEYHLLPELAKKKARRILR